MSVSAVEKNRVAETSSPEPVIASPAEASASAAAHPAATETVSLRPGGAFSFRPGGGFNKNTLASKAVDSANKDKSRFDSNSTKADGISLGPQYGSKASSSNRDFSVPRQEEEKPGQPEVDAFTDETRLFYHPLFLLKFQEQFTDIQPDLAEFIKENPDVDKTNFGSASASVFNESSASRFGGQSGSSGDDSGKRRGYGVAQTGIVTSGQAFQSTGPPLSSMYATASNTTSAPVVAAASTVAGAEASTAESASPAVERPVDIGSQIGYAASLTEMYGTLGDVALSAGANQPVRPKAGSQRPNANTLRTTENPWSMQAGMVKGEKDKVERLIKSTLNKLTLDNFASLSKKLTEIIAAITEPSIYEEAVFLVYDKSVSEPSFSHMYAELCVRLNKLSETMQLKDPNVTFRKVILNRCQTEFEKIATKQPSAAKEEAAAQATQDPEEVSARKIKERRLRTGNIKFIGELFKCQLLAEKTVHECIKDLLDAILQKTREPKEIVDRESLENDSELLCKLLHTIGKMLDVPKAKNYIDKYFEFINKYQKNELFSPRIRFMFMDVIELRARQWQPRREENAPKTIEEVHLEAMRKDLQEAALSDMHYRDEREDSRQQPNKILQAGGFETKGEQARSRQMAAAQAEAPKAPAIKAKKTVTKDDATELFEEVFDEYMKSNDPKDALETLKALQGARDQSDKLVEVFIGRAFDRSSSDRELVSKLLCALTVDRFLTPTQSIKGFASIENVLADLKVDVPDVEDMFAKFVKSALNDKVLTRDKLGLLDKRFTS